MLYYRKIRGATKAVGSLSLERQRDRGDTIVEVLLALAVLGAVIGAAYVVTNRSIITNLVAQERLYAVKLAETQFERLRINAATTPQVFSDTDFCMVNNPAPGNERAPASDGRCSVDGSGNPAISGVSPVYSIAITNIASVDIPGQSNAGARYRISISWEDASGRIGGDRLDQFYEVYR